MKRSMCFKLIGQRKWPTFMREPLTDNWLSTGFLFEQKKTVRDGGANSVFPGWAGKHLLDYLAVAPPALPTEETNKTPNTTNDQYNWRQINSVGQWSEFTYASIMQHYGTLLQQVQIASEPMPNSPPQPINTEPMFAVMLRRSSTTSGPTLLFSKPAVHSILLQTAVQET
uniref:Uncharacterized protein n=1 Tax=Coccidioides posadasii RMSCC 3488 TaxID=454284 RepID=A0A0J6IDF9_COCPO|nr:hypothetical protein CPAG_06081 [Coccidioides posadasii RMSCC 3488]